MIGLTRVLISFVFIYMAVHNKNTNLKSILIILSFIMLIVSIVLMILGL